MIVPFYLMSHQNRYFMGYWPQQGLGAFVCPHCSYLGESPEKHEYHLVEFNFGEGETEKKCSNCGSILFIKPYEEK